MLGEKGLNLVYIWSVFRVHFLYPMYTVYQGQKRISIFRFMWLLIPQMCKYDYAYLLRAEPMQRLDECPSIILNGYICIMWRHIDVIQWIFSMLTFHISIHLSCQQNMSGICNSPAQLYDQKFNIDEIEVKATLDLYDTVLIKAV